MEFSVCLCSQAVKKFIQTLIVFNRQHMQLPTREREFCWFNKFFFSALSSFSFPFDIFSLSNVPSMILYHDSLIFFPFDTPGAVFVYFSLWTYFLYNVRYTFFPILLPVLLVSCLPIVLLSIFPRFCFHQTLLPLQLYGLSSHGLCSSSLIVSLSNSSCSIVSFRSKFSLYSIPPAVL